MLHIPICSWCHSIWSLVAKCMHNTSVRCPLATTCEKWKVVKLEPTNSFSLKMPLYSYARHIKLHKTVMFQSMFQTRTSLAMPELDSTRLDSAKVTKFCGIQQYAICKNVRGEICKFYYSSENWETARKMKANNFNSSCSRKNHLKTKLKWTEHGHFRMVQGDPRGKSQKLMRNTKVLANCLPNLIKL